MTILVVLKPFKRGRRQMQPGDVITDADAREAALFVYAGLARSATHGVWWAPAQLPRERWVNAWTR